MTALQAEEINVHVVGIQFENPKQDQEVEEDL